MIAQDLISRTIHHITGVVTLTNVRHYPPTARKLDFDVCITNKTATSLHNYLKAKFAEKNEVVSDILIYNESRGVYQMTINEFISNALQ